MINEPEIREALSRRTAIKWLGLAISAAYVVPQMFLLSDATASSYPTPPSPPTAPSGIENQEPDSIAQDTCNNVGNVNPSQSVSFSKSDLERAQAAVEAGYAKPLSAIWPIIQETYDGNILGIQFTGFRWRPRYRFRAISTKGNLETVVVSARTGQIIRIVQC